MKKISFVIPIYNEEENIGELYRRLKQTATGDFKDFEYEIIFVDDGSPDRSVELLENLHNQDRNVKVVQFSRNFGHHIAITAGLDMALGDFVVMMDGDLQDQPEEISKLYNKLQEGYDVVYAERINKKSGLINRALSRLFNAVIRKLIDEPIVINSTIFRIMTRQALESMKLLRERNRYIVGVIGWVGFKHAMQKVEHGKRYAGKSKYDLSKRLSLALSAIFSFSNYPLRLIIKIGLFFVLVAFLVGALILYKKIFYGVPVLGWSSLILAILIMGGIQIIILGVIGEYVGRNYIETKNRPLYIVKKVWS